MNNQAISMIVEYRLVIMISALILLVLLSKRIRGPNNFLTILNVVLALSIIYEITMHEPVTRIASRINHALNQPNTSTKSSNPRYYVSPEKRYNLPVDE